MAEYIEFSQTYDQDPTGKDAHEPGAKLDAGKLRMGLVLLGFHRALQEVARVGTLGAAKYSDYGRALGYEVHVVTTADEAINILGLALFRNAKIIEFRKEMRGDPLIQELKT